MRVRRSFAVTRGRRSPPFWGSIERAMSTNLEWDNDDSLRLLDLYEKYAVLWNPRHSYYYNKTKKQRAWEAVARACGVPIAEVKRKMESLLSSFRRERCKSRKVQAAAAGDEKRRQYVSRWFAYKKMAFLLDKEEPKEFLDYDDDDVSPNDDPELITGDNNSSHATEDSPLFAVEAVYEPDPTGPDPEESSMASNPPQPKPPARVHERSRSANPIVPFKMLKVAKRPASDSEDDSRHGINEALSLLKSATAKTRAGGVDDCSTYGEHIANKLRGYDKRTRCIVEHHVNNILFQADMGEFENTTRLSSQPTATACQIGNQTNALGSVDSSSGLPCTSS